jgi:protein involved in polysaccharide export with SLBB domain
MKGSFCCSGWRRMTRWSGVVAWLVWVLGVVMAPAQVPRAEAVPGGVGSNYVLAAHDLIKLTVFQENDLETTVRVSKDGSVTFPLIGAVKVAGKTPQEAAKMVRDLLAKDYLVNPQVNLTVMEYSKRRFTVLGQVQRPGAFDMPDRDSVTLLQAIGMAGGYTRIADPAKITIRRNASGQDGLIKVNAKRMASGDSASDFTVVPGDVITVGESLF